MKNTVLLGLILSGWITGGFASQSTPSIPHVTHVEQEELQALQCQPQSTKDQNNRVLLGNVNGAERQLFLVKNISDQNIFIDFPEGHIGATAWITQYIPKNQWTVYLYIKGQGMLTVENAQGVTSQVRPYWACNSATAFNHPSQCQQLTYICEVTGAKATGTDSQQLAYHIINKGKVSWWLGVGSTIQGTLQSVIHNTGLMSS